jgi:hypothetical protein
LGDFSDSAQLRASEGADGVSQIAGENTPVARRLTSVSLADVAPFVALEAGVDEAAARRLLPFVARALGLSEGELAAALRRAL